MQSPMANLGFFDAVYVPQPTSPHHLADFYQSNVRFPFVHPPTHSQIERDIQNLYEQFTFTGCKPTPPCMTNRFAWAYRRAAQQARICDSILLMGDSSGANDWGRAVS
jgi:hypothetical protein